MEEQSALTVSSHMLQRDRLKSKMREAEELWTWHDPNQNWRDITSVSGPDIKSSDKCRMISLQKGALKKVSIAKGLSDPDAKPTEKRTSFSLPGQVKSIKKKFKMKKWKPKMKKQMGQPVPLIKMAEKELGDYFESAGVAEKVELVLTDLYKEKPWPENPLGYIAGKMEEKKGDMTEIESLLLELERHMIREGHLLSEIRRLRHITAMLLPGEYYPNGRPRTPPPEPVVEEHVEEEVEVQKKLKKRKLLTKPSVISKGKGKKKGKDTASIFEGKGRKGKGGPPLKKPAKK